MGSIAFRSRTRLPFLQKVKLARGSNSPGSVQRHLTSGPIFSITSNLTIPPSTRSSSPTLTSVRHYLLHQNTNFRTQITMQVLGLYKESMFTGKILLKISTFRKAIIVHMDGTFWKSRIKSSDAESPYLTILHQKSNLFETSTFHKIRHMQYCASNSARQDHY